MSGSCGVCRLLRKQDPVAFALDRAYLAEALQNCLEALEATRAMADSSLTALTALQISQVHLQEHRYLEAETSLNEAEAAGRECGDLRNLVRVLEAQGTLASRRRAYDEAPKLGPFVCSGALV